MLPKPPPSLIERVRKLLEKSAGTDNAHEADVFARKAAELVARHRIDPSHLARRFTDDLELIEVEVGRGAYVRARLALLGNIADAHDVRMVFRSTPTGSVAMLAGYGHDLRMVEMMYASLHQNAAVQMAEIRRATGASTQRHRRAFLFGFAERIGELLDAARVTSETNMVHIDESTDLVALALRERSERIADYAEASWGRVRSASRPSAVAPDGYLRGVAAAERADVGRTRLTGRKAIDR